MEKLKVAIVLPYFGAGGAEKMVFQLVAGMDQSKIHTEVFCVYGKPLGNAMERTLKDKGITIHYIGKELGFSFSAIFRLFKKLDRFSPDVIHTHLSSCMYAALWPLIRKKPILHTIHTVPEMENRQLPRRLLTKFLVKHKRMIPVAISKSNQRMVADYYAISLDRVPMIQNPVDVGKFAAGKPVKDGVFRFITVGRFSKEKNQQLMYRAFAAFLNRGHEARLLMLGKGEEEASLKALSKELGIADKIDYPGHVDNVEDYLKTADVFLLSSCYEAQPLCVLEAMAAGLPVISTDVGGVCDIVTDNGILVPADGTGAMADAMEKLYLDESVRKQMSQSAVKNVASFDVTNTVRGYSELYHQITDKKL